MENEKALNEAVLDLKAAESADQPEIRPEKDETGEIPSETLKGANSGEIEAERAYMKELLALMKERVKDLKPEKKTKEEKAAEKAKKKEEEEVSYFSTDFLDLQDIRDGIIITNDSRYVKIVEVIPGNFNVRSDEAKDFCLTTFQHSLQQLNAKFMLWVTNAPADVRPMIENLSLGAEKDGREEVISFAKRHAKWLNTYADRAGIESRYFIGYEYEPDSEMEGVAGRFDTIYHSMMNSFSGIQGAMESCGNRVVQNFGEDENFFQLQCLYEHYNRSSRYTEALEDRIARMNYDAKCYSEGLKTPKEYRLEDFVAPRGIDTTHPDLIRVDGKYHAFLAFRDNGYPAKAYGGWLDIFTGVAGIDIHVLVKKKPQAATGFIAERASVLTRNRAARAHSIKNIVNNKRRAYSTAMTAAAMNAGETLYSVVTIFNVWGDDPETIFYLRNQIANVAKKNGLRTAKSKENCDRFYRSVSPFLTFDQKIMNTLGHDFLSSSLSTMYNYTKFPLFDRKATMIGENIDSHAVIAFRLNNRRLFPNGNISITGFPGSGKTTAEEMLAARTLLLGHRNYMILPLKGYEYRGVIEGLGGEYVSLHPGVKTCVNLLAIYPEGDFFETDDEEKRMATGSLLAKKIKSVIAWIQLRLGKRDRLSSKDRSRLQALLTKVYADYGITNDNRSIFDQKGELKVMPTMLTLYEHAKEEREKHRDVLGVLESFIHGPYRNFVGQTNIDLNNPLIAFDVDDTIIDEDDLPSIMYIATDLSYSLAKQFKEYVNITIDEGWKLTINEDCGKQVSEMARILRGYGGGIIFASQFISDTRKTEYASAMYSSSSVKMIFRTDQDDLMPIKDALGLSEEEVMQINNFKTGQCMLITSGGIKMRINCTLSKEELALFDSTKKSVSNEIIEAAM